MYGHPAPESVEGASSGVGVLAAVFTQGNGFPSNTADCGDRLAYYIHLRTITPLVG